MRFSVQHEVDRPDRADWFDTNVEMDSPLYVDPFLVFDDESPLWKDAHSDFIRFFEAVLELIDRAGGQRASMHWIKAQRFLQFPEPKEFALGTSMGHPEGSGIGPDLAEDICEGLQFFLDQGRGADDRLLAMVSVLVPGLGVDRISDMVCNIWKSRFISYTRSICDDLEIPTQKFEVANSKWSASRYRWMSEVSNLPRSPVFDGAVLLTPHRFLKDIPRVTPDGFWSWAEANANESLRFDLNYDLATSLSRRQKVVLGRRLARSSLDLLDRYVTEASSQPTAYDVLGDPKGLVRWEEEGRRIAEATSPPVAPTNQSDFEQWLTELALAFKTAVEDNGLWRALWNDGNTQHRPEKIVQVIARQTWIEHCRAHNIDLTREADCGRGPVDFKFTQGWTLRGLIEVKHISSTQFAHGAETQLPIYLRGERAAFGVYVCVGYAARDFAEERLIRVQAACEAISALGKVKIVPIFVDARPQKSASKA